MVKPARTPTVYDVARLAEVSEATVSYVFGGRRGGKSRISKETRQRVLEVAAELGYVPNESARSLSRQRTERICLVLPDLGVPYFDAIAKELQLVANARGYSVIIAATGSAEQEKHVLNQLRRRLADGAIIISPHYIDEDDLALLGRARLSVVVYSNRIAANGFDVVRTTEAEACEQAVQYVLEKGHRQIALLGDSSIPIQQERLENYLNTFQQCGISIDPTLVNGDAGSRERAYHSTQSLLQLKTRPTAILTTSDSAAISAIWAIREATLHIPDDIAIIGMGNIPEGTITRPPLTTIGSETQGFSEFIHLLFSRLQGQAPSEGREHVQQWRLILRESA